MVKIFIVRGTFSGLEGSKSPGDFGKTFTTVMVLNDLFFLSSGLTEKLMLNIVAQ